MEKLVTAKLSDLAKIPTILLEKKMIELVNPEDKKKLMQALNLKLMRSLSHDPYGMFGMKNE